MSKWKMSDEGKKKIAEANRRRVISAVTRKKISEAAKGRVVTVETRKKISIANKGRRHSSETKQKLSNARKEKYAGKTHPRYGVHLSDETKDKIRKGNKGNKHTKETRKKMSESHKGYKHTSEAIDNMRISKKNMTKETKIKMSISAGKGEDNKKWKGGGEASKKRRYKKLQKDLSWKLSKSMSTNIRQTLKKSVKNGRHWETLVEYTASELKLYLLSTIPDGYTWNDFLSGALHIDHIIPISAFNFDSPEHIDFKRCWALNNLRLLPAKENLSKKDKLIKPLQLSLKIAI